MKVVSRRRTRKSLFINLTQLKSISGDAELSDTAGIAWPCRPSEGTLARVACFASTTAEEASAKHAEGRASASTTAEEAAAKHAAGRASASTTAKEASANHVAGRGEGGWLSHRQPKLAKPSASKIS